jgi:hypothetical protein
MGVVMRRLAMTVTIATMLAGPAIARDRDATTPSKALDELTKCTAIGPDQERLACFDRAVKTVVEGQRTKAFVVVDKVEVQRAKRSLFGFSLPSIKLFGGGDDDEALKELVAVMRSSVPLSGGLIRFELDDNSVWETTEQVMLAPRKGDRVTIKAGTLGSYVATAPGRRSARVRRLR